MKKYYLIICFLIITPLKADDLPLVVKLIEKGFKQNNINNLSGYFVDNCYLSLNNGTTGYYTSNQIYYIFEKYFNKYKVIDFNIDNYNKGNEQIIIEANIKYLYEGKAFNGQVLITLKNIYGKFVITQIFIS